MTDPLARLRFDWDGAESVRVTVSGEIDLSNADGLERELLTALAPARAVTIDLREVTYMDSQGVRLLHHLSVGLASDATLTVVAPDGTFAGGVLRVTRFPGLVDDA
ncbi:MAG TPA: STAS domain-containing protein [Gaiella sp.]|nr:STAS domain-containing protein [Gaiella sp.]